jgi:hypothetical protein
MSAQLRQERTRPFTMNWIVALQSSYDYGCWDSSTNSLKEKRRLKLIRASCLSEYLKKEK